MKEVSDKPLSKRFYKVHKEGATKSTGLKMIVIEFGTTKGNRIKSMYNFCFECALKGVFAYC